MDNITKLETKKRKKNYFFRGLIAILPLALSTYILWKIFIIIGRLTSPAFQKIFELFNLSYSDYFIYFSSIILTFALIWLLGLVVTNIFGRRVFLKVEHILIKLPLIKGIYLSVRKLLAHFTNGGMAFKKVVLIEYPRKGLYTLGFMTSEAKGYVQDATKEFVVNVFLPTTPNPTSGFLIMVPKEDIKELDISMDDAIRLIISGGIVYPGDKEGDEDGI